MSDIRQNVTSASDRTAVAAIVSIVMIIPAMIPAAIIVMAYAFVFKFFIGGSSWIPYVDEIGGLWFPEMLRGIILGGIAIWTSRRFFPTSNIEAVRFAAFAFWAGVLALLVIFSMSVRGITFDIVGVVGLAVGLCVGLWSTDT